MRLPEFIWFNGNRVFPNNNEILPAEILIDRATSFGDGVFETMLVKNSKIAFIEFHLTRLSDGIKILNIDHDINDIQNELNSCLCSLNSKFNYVLKYMISRGSSVFGYGSKNIKTNSFIIIDKLQHKIQSSVKLMTCTHKLSTMPGLSGIKHCNRLDQVIAKREVENTDKDDGIMLDYKGNIVETTSANIFIIEGDTILTPSIIDCGVKGVVREILIKKIIPILGLNVSEEVISPERLFKSNGCFITNSIQGPCLVEEVDFNNKFVKFPRVNIFKDILKLYNNLLVE